MIPLDSENDGMKSIKSKEDSSQQSEGVHQSVPPDADSDHEHEWDGSTLVENEVLLSLRQEYTADSTLGDNYEKSASFSSPHT